MITMIRACFCLICYIGDKLIGNLQEIADASSIRIG